MSDVMKMLLEEVSKRSDHREETVDPAIAAARKEQTAEDLLVFHDLMSEQHDFKVRDLIQWKRGMRNKKGYGPFVVVKVLDEVMYPEEVEAGSAYFREPLHLIIGLIDKDGDFLCYYVNKNRYEPYVG